MNQLAEDICRVVGHDWDFPKCARCSKVDVLEVYNNGIVYLPGRDYIVEKDRLLFTATPARGEKIRICIGSQDSRWGDLTIIGDGASKAFLIYDPYN